MPRVLVADDDDGVRSMLRQVLERDGFEVVAVGSVPEALARIAAESFDLLLSDLHMPRAGDGFTVVSAMRHTHPHAATVVLSGYPAMDEAWAAIRLQADEILVKPIEVVALRAVIRHKIANPIVHRPPHAESVATILEHDLNQTISNWMDLVEHDAELTWLPLSFDERTGHLPNLIADLIYRLRLPPVEKAEFSAAARAHGKLRHTQGYTAAMIVEESRILQVSIFNTLQTNLPRVDFSKVLLDVMIIADEVDSQLKQAMLSFVECGSGPRPLPLM